MTAFILLVCFLFLLTLLTLLTLGFLAVFMSTQEFSHFLSSYFLPYPTVGAKLPANVKTLSLG